MARNSANAPLFAALQRAQNSAPTGACGGVSAAGIGIALDSLRRFPRPITNASELSKLAGCEGAILALATTALRSACSDGAGAAASARGAAAAADAAVAAAAAAAAATGAAAGLSSDGKPPRSVIDVDLESTGSVFELPDAPLAERLRASRGLPATVPAPARPPDGILSAATAAAPAPPPPGVAVGGKRAAGGDASRKPEAKAAKRAAGESASSARPAPGGGAGASVAESAHAAAAVEPERAGTPTFEWSCACCGRSHVGEGLRPPAMGAAPAPLRWRVVSDAARPALLPEAGGGAAPPPRPCASAAASTPHVCELDSASWEVVLCVDTREVRSRADRTYIADQLRGRGVAVDVRTLVLGDFLWVARRREGAPRPPPRAAPPPPAPEPAVPAAASTATGAAPRKRGGGAARKAKPPPPPPPPPWEAAVPGAREFVLDAIVERKSVVDLASSVVDGRYGEQKLRLAACGLRVTYLVEGDAARMVDTGGGAAPRIGSAQIRGAMVTTQVQNGFRVVATTTVDATIEWLVKMTRALTAQFHAAARCGSRGGVPAAAAARGGGGCGGGGSGAFWAANLAQAAPGRELMLSSALARAAAAAAVGDNDGASADLSGGDGVTTPASGADAGAALAHLCRDDRCNLWGRGGMPYGGVQSYDEFCATAGRPRAVTALHLFGMMLRQVGGLSADRAQAVLERYPTPAALARAYDGLHHRVCAAGPGMLRDLVVPAQKNALGPAVSAAVYATFNARPPGSGPAAARGEEAFRELECADGDDGDDSG